MRLAATPFVCFVVAVDASFFATPVAPRRAHLWRHHAAHTAHAAHATPLEPPLKFAEAGKANDHSLQDARAMSADAMLADTIGKIFSPSSVAVDDTDSTTEIEDETEAHTDDKFDQQLTPEDAEEDSFSEDDSAVRMEYPEAPAISVQPKAIPAATTVRSVPAIDGAGHGHGRVRVEYPAVPVASMEPRRPQTREPTSKAVPQKGKIAPKVALKIPALKHVKSKKHAHRSSHAAPSVGGTSESHGFMSVRATRRNAASCYVNQDFPAPDSTEDCSDGEDACLIRVAMDFSTGETETIRYCSSTQLCASLEMNQWHQERSPSQTTYTRCCNSPGCNDGIPVPIADGYYWIRPYSTDAEFLTYNHDSTLNMNPFANDDSQKWYVQRAESRRGSTNFHLIPAELVPEAEATSGDAYRRFADRNLEVLETDFFGYTVLERGSAPVPQPLLTGSSDAKAKFSFTPTLQFWEVGVAGRSCPARLHVPTATTLQECYLACLADAHCSQMEMLEWDTENSQCHVVVGACPHDETTAASDYVYRFQAKCATVVCPESHCQEPGTCNPLTGACSDGAFRTQGHSCDDGDAFTVDDVCSGEADVCAGRDRCEGVECAAPQCHSVAAGVVNGVQVVDGCDRANGQCQFVLQADGTTCDDGDRHTVDDRCVGGQCRGTDLCESVECAPQDSCHVVGACRWQDGTCPQTAKPDHTPCDDGVGSTVEDECIAGVCVGKADRCADISCQAASPCHEAGECDPETGQCSNPHSPSDKACDDLSDQTGDDKCNGAGVCLGRDLCEGMACPPQDQCHAEGHCNPGTGQCMTIFKTDHSRCGENQEKECLSGVCEDIDLCLNVVCAYGDQCLTPSECNPDDGTCGAQTVKQDEDCDDGLDATIEDKCVVVNGVGLCQGQTPSVDLGEGGAEEGVGESGDVVGRQR